MIAATDPAQVLRRSQLYRWHNSRGAVLIAQGGAVFVDRYGDPRNEASSAGNLGICDLSLLPRHGIIGPGSTTWLRARGYELPQQANTCVIQSNDDLLVRLSAQELLCLRLSALVGSAPANQPEWPGDTDDQAYPAPRADSHCLFAVTGIYAATMFSKLCGVDLRPHKFADGWVAQTSVARVNAIIIRHDLQATNGFFLLTATSAAEYLWECVADAMVEYDGKPVGIAALQSIAKTRS